jgi:hypothetical protein
MRALGSRRSWAAPAGSPRLGAGGALQPGLKFGFLLKIFEVKKHILGRLISALTVLAQRLPDNALDFIGHIGNQVHGRHGINLQNRCDHITGGLALPVSISYITDPKLKMSLRRGLVAVSAHTEAGMVIGTAKYMSPEQARGQVVDARSVSRRIDGSGVDQNASQKAGRNCEEMCAVLPIYVAIDEAHVGFVNQCRGPQGMVGTFRPQTI